MHELTFLYNDVEYTIHYYDLPLQIMYIVDDRGTYLDLTDLPSTLVDRIYDLIAR